MFKEKKLKIDKDFYIRNDKDVFFTKTPNRDRKIRIEGYYIFGRMYYADVYLENYFLYLIRKIKKWKYHLILMKHWVNQTFK